MISKTAFARLLSEVPDTLRACANEIRTLREEKAALMEKVASYKLAEEVVELMEERGLSDGLPSRQKVAALMESGKDLKALHTALKMRPADMSFSKVAQERESGGRSSDDEFWDSILN